MTLVGRWDVVLELPEVDEATGKAKTKTVSIFVGLSEIFPFAFFAILHFASFVHCSLIDSFFWCVLHSARQCD